MRKIFIFQWLCSLVFVFQMYLAMAIFGIVFAPWALFSEKGARAGPKAYCRWVLWTARWMVGIKSEVRGTPPTGRVIIASKHQSFLDIIMLFHSVPAAYFIMKKELLWAPVLGQYAKGIGCIPVDRGKRSQAISQMLKDVDAGKTVGEQLIIYPQGTRVAPGATKPYKSGIAALYTQMGQPCVPVAVNVGVFWPRTGIMRKPGTAVIEFLETIPPGVETDKLMSALEETIEKRSNALMAEAGFTAAE